MTRQCLYAQCASKAKNEYTVISQVVFSFKRFWKEELATQDKRNTFSHTFAFDNHKKGHDVQNTRHVTTPPSHTTLNSVWVKRALVRSLDIFMEAYINMTSYVRVYSHSCHPCLHVSTFGNMQFWHQFKTNPFIAVTFKVPFPQKLIGYTKKCINIDSKC